MQKDNSKSSWWAALLNRASLGEVPSALAKHLAFVSLLWTDVCVSLFLSFRIPSLHSAPDPGDVFIVASLPPVRQFVCSCFPGPLNRHPSRCFL